MLEGKAMIDLRFLENCDADGRCVKVCPTRVVSLSQTPADGNDVPATAKASQAVVAPGIGGMQIPVGNPLPGAGASKGVSLSVLPR
jgi:ferredoxin